MLQATGSPNFFFLEMTLCVMEAATNDAGLEVPVLIFVCKKELKVSYETTKG
jgi:hypothetical protein